MSTYNQKQLFRDAQFVVNNLDAKVNLRFSPYGQVFVIPDPLVDDKQWSVTMYQPPMLQGYWRALGRAQGFLYGRP